MSRSPVHRRQLFHFRGWGPRSNFHFRRTRLVFRIPLHHRSHILIYCFVFPLPSVRQTPAQRVICIVPTQTTNLWSRLLSSPPDELVSLDLVSGLSPMPHRRFALRKMQPLPLPSPRHVTVAAVVTAVSCLVSSCRCGLPSRSIEASKHLAVLPCFRVWPARAEALVGLC